MKKKFYMISWKTKHFSLLTFFENSFFQKKFFFQKIFKKFFWKNEFFFLKYFFYKSKFYNEFKKKSKNFFLTKFKIMMLIISPKRKIAVLEMALKSSNISKLDHQMSKSWKKIAAHELEITSKFDLLENWVPDCSA